MRTLLLISTLLLQASPSRPAPGALPTRELALSVDVDLVNVLFTVSDHKGHLVPSLSREKFQVFDDNKAQVISHFSSETDLPLTLALLIDTSGSVHDKVGFERDAAVKFLESTMRRGKDRALLITFDLRVNLLQDYTDDIGALARSAENIMAGGGTPLYDAIFMAASEKMARQTGRRVAILISDGVDTTSRKSLDEALRAAQQNETTIYCISTNSILENSLRAGDGGNKILHRLAEETGGRVFLPDKTSDLASVFKKINEELRSQYTLAYSPTDVRQDGSFHKIRIETKDRQLRANARNGYVDARKK